MTTTTRSIALLSLALLGLALPARAQARPGVISSPASPANYDTGRPGAIDTIVIHDIEGDVPGALATFGNPAAQVSAHYVVGYDGRIWQCVADGDTAWHAGNYPVNQRSIGIEHAGFAGRQLYTQAEYEASALLVASLCAQYGIPIDRQARIGHAEVPDLVHPGRSGGSGNHTDPGPTWDWDGYLTLVRAASYASAFVGQSQPSLRLRSGDAATVWFEVRNTGALAWSGLAARLGTQGPQDRTSAFFSAGDWTGPDRPTTIDRDTASGGVARYTFVVTAPAVTATQTFHEAFRQVQEGLTWFGPLVAIDITVDPVAPSTPTTTTPAPSVTSTPAPSVTSTPPAPASPPVTRAPAPTPTPSAPTAAPATPRARARLHVTTDPAGAAIYLSASEDGPGRRLGQGGETFDLPAGRVVITAVRPPFAARAAVVTLGPGRTTDTTLVLGSPRAPAFGDGVTLATVGALPALADLDGDGLLDLVAGGADGSVTLSRGVARGLRLGPGALLARVAGPAAPALCDWDGDGALDLVLGQADGAVFLLRGDGRGGFGASALLARTVGPAAPFACDLDDDGALDLVVGRGDGHVELERRLASGALEAGVLLADDAGVPLEVPGPARAIARDLDGDGLLDLVVCGAFTTRVLAGTGSSGAPRFRAVGPLLAGSGAGTPVVASSVALADVDGDGLLDLVASEDGALRLRAASALRGDVDDSRRCDARDLILVQRARGSVRGEGRYLPAADLDEDGAIDAKDTALMLQRLGDAPR